MEYTDLVIFFATAIAAGALNSVAGGGTFLTFPVLIFGGLTPIQANVTSTVAVWPGTAASAWAYRRQWRQQKKMLPALAAISALGGALGAAVLLATPERVFAGLVPWLLLAATLIFTFGNKGPGVGDQGSGNRSLSFPTPDPRPPAPYFLQFAIAFYGGYFGAGIGILMLAALSLLGLTDIHQMNGLKNLFALCINVVATVYFMTAGLVEWPVAATMALGAISGGYGGAGLARRLGPIFVRKTVIAIGFAMTISLFIKQS